MLAFLAYREAPKAASTPRENPLLNENNAEIEEMVDIVHVHTIKCGKPRCMYSAYRGITL